MNVLCCLEKAYRCATFFKPSIWIESYTFKIDFHPCGTLLTTKVPNVGKKKELHLTFQRLLLYLEVDSIRMVMYVKVTTIGLSMRDIVTI
jgi:hypothetical protein